MDARRAPDMSHDHLMPKEFPDKPPVVGARRSVHESPELVFASREARGVPQESPNREQNSFYRRKQRDRLSSASEAESITGDDKEFLFPIERDCKSSMKASSSLQSCSYSSSPRSNHKVRAHSVSVTNPLCKSSYASLPQSPATSFLAQFAQPDDWRGQEEVKDGAIINNYRVGKVIGRGSFSECREAIFDDGSEDERERVAMKIVKAEKAESDNLSDFDKELSVWRRLSHDNILPLLDCIRSDGIRIAVSPVAENGTLLDYISNHGPFSETQAKIIFRQICQAVFYMHIDHGIVHRDIKLDNILLDSQLRPYLCDFGLSECTRHDDELDVHCLEGRCRRSEGELFCKGSLWYIPPEELGPDLLTRSPKLAPGEYRKKGDIWSLGVVLYGMATGKLPFTDDFLPRLQATVTAGQYPPLPETLSKSLHDLVSKLLTVNVDDRPCIAKVILHEWLGI